VGAIPEAWLEPLELRDVITEIAADLYRCSQDPAWDAEQECSKYPGW
jgi:hypothetical protein